MKLTFNRISAYARALLSIGGKVDSRYFVSRNVGINVSRNIVTVEVLSVEVICKIYGYAEFGDGSCNLIDCLCILLIVAAEVCKPYVKLIVVVTLEHRPHSDIGRAYGSSLVFEHELDGREVRVNRGCVVSVGVDHYITASCQVDFEFRTLVSLSAVIYFIKVIGIACK